MSGADAINPAMVSDSNVRIIAARGEHSESTGFAAMFESIAREVDGRGEHEAESSLRGAAEKLLSSAFILPVLTSLRENSQAASPFAPGVAERRFGPLLDQQIADSIVRGENFGLVDSIVDRFAPAEPQPAHVEVTA